MSPASNPSRRGQLLVTEVEHNHMASVGSLNDTSTAFEPVGLQAMIERTLPKCRTASVRHLEKTVRVHQARKGELMFRQGQPVATTIDRLALFLNILTEKVDSFLHQESRRRVMRVLVRHRDLFFSDPPVLTRAHLPGRVGPSREMTGRVLRDLEREGTLGRVGRSGLTLLNPAWLEAGESDEPRPLKS